MASSSSSSSSSSPDPPPPSSSPALASLVHLLSRASDFDDSTAGPPVTIEALHKLTSLDLGSITPEPLTAIPDAFLASSAGSPGAQAPPGTFPSSLVELDLFNNEIERIPREFPGRLTSLTALYLNANHLREIPDTIGQLSGLKVLSLSENKLITLPKSIGQLKSLTCLYLYKNRLEYLPESLGKLESLARFIAHDNCLSILPALMAGLSSELSISAADGQTLLDGNPWIPEYHKIQHTWKGLREFLAARMLNRAWLWKGWYDSDSVLSRLPKEIIFLISQFV